MGLTLKNGCVLQRVANYLIKSADTGSTIELLFSPLRGREYGGFFCVQQYEIIIPYVGAQEFNGSRRARARGC